MILGKNYIYVEVPFTESDEVACILEEQCGGDQVTPIFDPLVEVPERFTVFTSIMKPYTRMSMMYDYHTVDPPPNSFIDWYEWIKSRDDDPWYITRPYNFWTSNCDKVLKIEKIKDQLPKLLKELGYKIEIDSEPDLSTSYKLSPEEVEYVKKERHSDFGPHGYTMNLRG